MMSFMSHPASNSASHAAAGRTPFYRHALVAFIFTLVVVLVLPRVFSENDDLGFIFLLEHGFYAPWLSKPFCGLLLQLYQAFPGWGWYGVLQYVILALDLAVLFRLVDDWAVSQALSGRVRRWLGVLAGLLFLPFIMRITFTSAAIWSGGLGLLAFLASLGMAGQRPRWQVLWSALGVGLVFSLCYLVRPEAVGAMIFLLPVMVWAAFAHRRKLFSRFGMLLVLCFLLPLTVWMGLDRWAISYPAEQRPYLNFVVSSNDVFGFGYTEQFKVHPEWLAPMGWTREDYGMLERFLYWDETRFSQEKIDQAGRMASVALRARLDQFLDPAFALNRIGYTFAKTWLSNYPFTLYCIGLLLLFGMMGQGRPARRLPLVMLGFVFVLTVLMQGVLRFPYRVASPVILLGALGMLALPGFSVGGLYGGNRRMKRPAVLLLWVCGLCLVIFNGPVRLVKTWSAPLAETRARLAELNRLQTDRYILREAGVIQVSAFDPLQVNPLSAPDIGPGWLIRSVPYYERLRAFGLTQGSELIPASLNNPHFVYFFKDKNLPFLAGWVEARYQRPIAFQQADSLLRSTFHEDSHLYQAFSPEMPVRK